MSVTLADLLKAVSRACGDYVWGIATSGTTTSLLDSRLATSYSTDDEFNGGILVINEGAGQMLFASSCESVPPGDFTSVTVTDTACILQRDKTYKHAGRWSYKAKSGGDASDAAYVQHTLAATNTDSYAQMLLYCAAVPGYAFTLLTLNQAAGTEIMAIKVSATGVLSVYNTPADTTYTLDTAVTLTAGSWYRIELRASQSATLGIVEMWANEAQVLSRRAQNTGSTAFGAARFGIQGCGAGAVTLWFDDVKVDAAYIGTRLAETEKTITDYTGATGAFAWSGAIVSPVAGSRYAGYHWPTTKWSKEQKKQAIGDVSETLWPSFFKRKTDPATDSGTATITIASNTFQYLLPEDAEYICDLSLEPATVTEPYGRISAASVDGPSGARYLRLPYAGGYTTGRSVRIIYLARPTRLQDDNDELQVDAAYEGYARDYIVNAALARLWESTQSPGDADIPMSQKFAMQAERVRALHSMKVPPSFLFTDQPVRRRSITERIDPTIGGTRV